MAASAEASTSALPISPADADANANANAEANAEADSVVVIDDGDANEDEGAAGEEEEYEIETILAHEEGRFVAGEMAYLVAWKGYGEEDNSWVREIDAAGATEMIKDYWARTPRTQVKKTNNRKRKSPAVPAKRKARNTLSPSPDQGDEDDDVRLREIANDASLTPAEKARREKELLEQSRIERMRKKYGRIADWDEIVRKIEAVERNDQGKLIMFVLFNSGDRLAFESIVCHHRCPLKVIQFYESHLRFKPTEGMSQYRAPSPLESNDASDSATATAETAEANGNGHANVNGNANANDGDDDDDIVMLETDPSKAQQQPPQHPHEQQSSAESTTQGTVVA